MALIPDGIFEKRVSIRLYGVAAIALGLVGLFWGDFAAVWQPVPKDLAGRTVLAYIVAVIFLLSGLAMQWPGSAARAALALTILYSLGVVLLHIPSVIAHPAVFVTWSGTAEQLALVAGGLVAFAYCAQLEPASALRLTKIGRLIFGVCLLIFGLAHIVYLGPTADYVPAWIPPGKIFWAYATAAGHIAAGIAILSGVLARTAAMLLTAMFVVFSVLVHAPNLFADPHTHFNWAANAINFALIASAWVIAASIPASRSANPAGAIAKA